MKYANDRGTAKRNFQKRIYSPYVRSDFLAFRFLPLFAIEVSVKGQEDLPRWPTIFLETFRVWDGLLLAGSKVVAEAKI